MSSIRGKDADTHLVGGSRAIDTFVGLGALDRLELAVLL
jgi:hypothetical protein